MIKIFITWIIYDIIIHAYLFKALISLGRRTGVLLLIFYFLIFRAKEI